MCRAAVAVGCDGLLLEVHPNPSKAMSDGAQTVTPQAFAELMAECRRVAAAVGKTIDGE
jgi:3-deoxy-7-phosphoheptulonate synthase